jgi:two-component system sensor histidine kinase PilS (NtrC family)
VILVTFLFGVTILVSSRASDPEVVSSFTSLYLLIGYAYLLTGVSAFIFKYIRRPVLFSYLQIMGDIVFITGILQITGGIESPFIFLYFLSIISGSILRYQQGSLVAALLSGLSYAILFYANTVGITGYHFGNPVVNLSPPVYYRSFLNLFSFFVIAFLSNQLARRLKKAGEEIQQREDSIEDLEVLHENIVQSVTSGLITTDLTGKITSANSSSEKILEISTEEILQSNLEELFPYSKVHEYLTEDALKEEEESSRFEITYINPRSQEIILGMTLSLLRNKRGERTGFICTFQNLTEIKALEEKMRQKEQLAMIGELAAGIAHEIRNPLASMSGSIQVLQNELKLDKENQKLMGIIIKETDRLNTLIGNFLMYARPRPLDCQSSRIKELVDETVTLLKNNNRATNFIHFETDVEDDAEALVDSMAMRQVLWNLATNAIEAMPEGGALSFSVRKVTHRNSSNGGNSSGFVRVTVTDTGSGIHPEIQSKLFFPFHTMKEGGSGLGLAIVHQLVQQHGGWIDVVNHPGKGAAFHLYLPETVKLAAS